MKRGKVLIVASQGWAVSSLKYLLTIDGYEVRLHPSVIGAARSVGEFRPSIVLIDPQIEGGDPCALARAIRSNSNAKIVIRRRHDGEDLKSCLADAEISSAKSPSELLELIHQLI